MLVTRNHGLAVAAFILTSLLSMQIFAAEQEYDVEVVIVEDISGKYAKSENWPTIPEEIAVDNKPTAITNAVQNEKRYKFLPAESYKLNDDVKRMEESREFRVLLHTAWRQTGLDKSNAFPVHIATHDANASGSYIEGDFTLVMSRYLHISGDLTFYKDIKGSFVPYPVSFSRRMRSRETHYIDHPMLGIIVLATPVSR